MQEPTRWMYIDDLLDNDLARRGSHRTSLDALGGLAAAVRYNLS